MSALLGLVSFAICWRRRACRVAVADATVANGIAVTEHEYRSLGLVADSAIVTVEAVKLATV